MLSKIQTFIVVMCLAVILIVGVFIFYLSRQGASNPEGTVGNTAGNLNNRGLFCEYDGTVYFSNAYDGGSLYAMDSTEENIRRLNGLNVRSILAGGDSLYFFQRGASGSTALESALSVHSFSRCSPNGSNIRSLSRNYVITAQLVDNYLYLLVPGGELMKLIKIGTDGSGEILVADYEINPACASDGFLYYNGTQTDHYLYRMDTDTDMPQVIWEGNLWYPCIEGDYIYFLDVGSNYRLCRYNLSQGLTEVLTQDRVDCFNVGHGYIYYQKNGDAPQLICMREDGTDAFVLAEGNYTNINMTSQYVYFQEYGNDASYYHSRLGYGIYEEFSEAREAALNEK